MKISHYSISDTGLKRDHNEDWVLVSEKNGLYLLADGIGGHAGGEAASKLALNTVLKEFVEHPVVGDEEWKTLHKSNRELPEAAQRLVFSILRANSDVLVAAEKYKKLRGMGTTITAVMEATDTLFIAHVGDSRIYMMRAGEFKQLTEDHSFLTQELKRGTITSEQAKDFPLKNRLTKAIGHMNTNMVDVQEISPQKGDVILMCSDGLTDMLEDGEIHDILKGNEDLKTVAKNLVAGANKAGGIDNISIVLVRVEENL